MLSSLVNAIPKELYLLIGAGLGFMGAMITTLITSRTQLRIARETHKQQYEIESLKVQAQAKHEELKVQAEEENEAQIYLRSKLEEAHQILSKLAMENSQEACFIMSDLGTTEAEYHMQYQRQQVDMQRLHMLAALYFPKLQDLTNELAGLTSQFWGYQQILIAAGGMKGMKGGSDARVQNVIERAYKIQACTNKAQNLLQGLVYKSIPSSFK